MTVLQDIGASRAGTSLSNYVTQERELMNRTNLTEARSAELKTRTEVNQNVLADMRRKRAEENKPIAWATFENRFKVPEVKDYARKLAASAGYLNKDGTIKAMHVKEVEAWLKSPMHLPNISGYRVEHAQKQYETLVRASKDPEFAKKNNINIKSDEFPQAIKQAELRYNSAIGSHKPLLDRMEQLHKQQELESQKAENAATRKFQREENTQDRLIQLEGIISGKEDRKAQRDLTASEGKKGRAFTRTENNQNRILTIETNLQRELSQKERDKLNNRFNEKQKGMDRILKVELAQGREESADDRAKRRETFDAEQKAIDRVLALELQIQRDFSATEREALKQAYTVEENEKKAKVSVWILPNKNIVRSYDQGKTYVGEDGTLKAMPKEGAVKSSAQYTGTEIATLKEQQRASKEEKVPSPRVTPESVSSSAEAGTGLYSNLEAGIDAVLGGLGVDKLVGKEGFFKDTQDARQKLRLIKQLGKSAFMNSSRGAIWEQQKIDKLFPNPNKLFANPRTEARKFATLREALFIEREFNSKAMQESPNPKEIAKFKESNADINRLLAHIGTGEKSAAITESDEALIQKYLKK